jgi:hypothetical protein
MNAWFVLTTYYYDGIRYRPKHFTHMTLRYNISDRSHFRYLIFRLSFLQRGKYMIISHSVILQLL